MSLLFDPMVGCWWMATVLPHCQSPYQPQASLIPSFTSHSSNPWNLRNRPWPNGRAIWINFRRPVARAPALSLYRACPSPEQSFSRLRGFFSLLLSSFHFISPSPICLLFSYLLPSSPSPPPLPSISHNGLHSRPRLQTRHSDGHQGRPPCGACLCHAQAHHLW